MVEKATKETNDELRREDIEADIANKREEIKIFEDSIAEQEKLIEMVDRQRELKEEMHDLAMEDFVREEAPWKFMMNPDWVALQKEYTTIQHAFEMRELNNKLEQMKAQITRKEDQIQSLEGNIAKLTAELEEQE